jgi:pimeloyl-ACP methyl ester carboxylesterase
LTRALLHPAQIELVATDTLRHAETDFDRCGLCSVYVSAGTFVASYIAKQHPHRMRGCVLIDPVCLGMFMPNLIYNFRELLHFPFFFTPYTSCVWVLLGFAQLTQAYSLTVGLAPVTGDKRYSGQNRAFL